jgi:hypothetical protein
MGSATGLAVLAPLGAEKAYASAASFPTGWGGLAATTSMVLGDMGGYGALDLVGVRPHAGQTTIDILSQRAEFNACSHYRWLMPADVTGQLTALGDIDGDSRSDLVAVTGSDTVTVTSATRAGTYDDVSTTELNGPGTPVSVAIGDLDGDRRGDLFVAYGDGTLQVWSGPAFDAMIGSAVLPAPADLMSVGDRNGDGSIELFTGDVKAGAVQVSVYDTTTWSASDSFPVALSGAVALGAADEDGDGRSDISVLNGTGKMVVYVGNSATGRPVDGWWANPSYECPSSFVPLSFQGTFYDDDMSQFEADIERIAKLGITKGCNPPYNDAYCPSLDVTRGQMAAFLVRALGLPAAPGDPFTDDDDSPFAADIAALAAAGITKGCTATTFCPDDPVTRGQMAAFIARGYDLRVSSASNRFTDDDGSVFEQDIHALADAGVTKGCNPPSNDRYCPNDPVTRDQMAAFLGRATQIR